MPKRKHGPEEIAARLRQVDVLLCQGKTVGKAVNSIGVSKFCRMSPQGGTSTYRY